MNYDTLVTDIKNAEQTCSRQHLAQMLTTFTAKSVFSWNSLLTDILEELNSEIQHDYGIEYNLFIVNTEIRLYDHPDSVWTWFVTDFDAVLDVIATITEELENSSDYNRVAESLIYQHVYDYIRDATVAVFDFDIGVVCQADE